MDDLRGRIEIMDLFVYNMAKVGHVKYHSIISPELVPGNLVSDSIPEKEDFRIIASITPEGFLFLNKERDRRNAKNNNTLQILLTVITVIFIGITALYAKFTYDLQNYEILKSKDKNQLQKTIELKADTTKYLRKEAKKTSPKKF